MIKVLKYSVWVLLLTGVPGCTEFDFSDQTNKISLSLKVHSIRTFPDSGQIHLILGISDHQGQDIQTYGQGWYFNEDKQWNYQTIQRSELIFTNWPDEVEFGYSIYWEPELYNDPYLRQMNSHYLEYGMYIKYYTADQSITVRGLITFADSIILYSDPVTISNLKFGDNGLIIYH